MNINDIYGLLIIAMVVVSAFLTPLPDCISRKEFLFMHVVAVLVFVTIFYLGAR